MKRLFGVASRKRPDTTPASLFQQPAMPRAPRARQKWVSHGLSNRVVYGGLHYGARWLPLPVLNGINLFGNSLAVAFMRRTQEGIRENYRLGLEASPEAAARLTRRLFFEYGRATIDTWRLRSEAFTPRITTLEEDARILAGSRRGGRGFLLVTGHVGNWEMGAVTLRAHGLTAAVVGQPELDPNVQEMRLKLRARAGRRVDRHRLLDGDRVQGPRRRGPRPRRRPARRPRLSGGPRLRPVLQAPDAVPALSRASRALLRLRRPPRFLPALARRLLLQHLGRSSPGRPLALAGRGRRPHHVPRGRGPGEASSARTPPSGSTSTGSGTARTTARPRFCRGGACASRAPTGLEPTGSGRPEGRPYSAEEPTEGDERGLWPFAGRCHFP